MAVAVICEFNPFHNGHKYLVNTSRLRTGEGVIAVMSGSFTQRGEVALTDKFTRAKAALKNGVALVVELPAVHAVANAQRFAQGGVEIAKSFSCVNYLAFGCETDDLDLLNTAAFSIYNDKVNSLIAEYMKRGDYYPRAVENAVRGIYGDEVAQVLASPNNILAVEYIRALKGSGIRPLPIKRKGVAHDSSICAGNIASASHIRDLLRNGESVEEFLPSVPTEITYPENLDRAILYKLRTMSAEEIKKLPDVGEGLQNRIIEASRTSGSVEELIASVKTKRYTHARLRRIITCAYLGITENLQSQKAGYVRPLGFTQAGAEMLSACTAKVVTSAAKFLKTDECDNEIFKKDILATDLATLAFNEIRPCGSDFYTKIIKEFELK